MKNRWGDPLLVHYPVSKVSVGAFVLAGLALICAAIPFVSPANEFRQPIYGPEGAAILAVIQLFFTVAGMVMAYVALLCCGINDVQPGRGLAWAALAASYTSALSLSAILAAWMPILSWLSLAVAIVGVLHILAFAAESTFAKHAVTLLLIGSTFFSLFSCALLHSREQARRLQCQRNLQQLGMQLSLLSETPVERNRIMADEAQLQHLVSQALESSQLSPHDRQQAPGE